MTTTVTNASPRAFVAGATGYVGRHVVHALRARGFEVHAHVRPDSTALARWRTTFEHAGATTDTTPWTADAMRATLARIAPTHVFALLGTTRRRMRASATAGHNESYQSVDYGLTHLLLEATRLAAPGARFIYLSAVGVSPGVRNPYLAARARVEAELAASALSHLIAQPAYITGDDREEARPVERFVATALDAVMALLDRIGLDALAGRYRTLTGPEVASGLVQLACVPTVPSIIVDARALRIAARESATRAR
jgi:nucleoside-diphosphate-sugar epimerase